MKTETKRYQLVVCDDQRDQIDILLMMIGRAEVILSEEEVPVKFEVHSFNNYEGVIDFLENNQISGGIYLLDIELGKDINIPNGIDIADYVKNQDPDPQIIFVTTHDNMAHMTFERRIGAIDYICKEKGREYLQRRITESLGLAMRYLSQNNLMKRFTFSYKLGRKIYNINIDDICSIETTDTSHRLVMNMEEKRIVFPGNINAVAKNNPLLKQISQSCLINPKNIKDVDLVSRTITMLNDQKVTFSRTKSHEVRKMIESINHKEESWIL